MNNGKWNIRTAVMASLSTLAVASPATQAADVKLFLQAPFDYKTGAFNLDDIETYNSGPVFSKSFTIPYAQLQDIVTQKLQQKVNKSLSGTVVCTDPCPDVSYSVNVTSAFAFTQTGQPTLQPFGDATENGVTVSLEGVQAKINLNIAVHAETWFDSGDVDIPIEVLVGAHGVSSVKIWPNLAVPQAAVTLTLDGSNVNITGLNGEAIQLGVELGSFIGLSPLGVAVGGPIGGAILGAILGDAAADEAERQVKAIVTHRLETAIATANDMLESELTKYITPTVAQANAWKDQLLNKPLPGVGQSLNSLKQNWGVDLDVRSWVVNNSLRTVASTRFSSAPNGGATYGRVRLPKTQCVYSEINNRIIGHIKLPIATSAHNEDLAGQVGVDCNQVLGNQALSANLYLGENPEAKLASGNPANDLPRWTQAGLLSFTGTLQDKGSYYECAFNVNALPAAGITEMAANNDLAARLTELFPAQKRSMHIPVAGTTQILNSKLLPYGPSGILIGGKGPESTEDCPSEHEGGTGWQKNFDFGSKFDPETCPQCGFDIGAGKFNEVIYVARNPDAFAGVWAFPEVQGSRGVLDSVALNPQPLPPKTDIGLGQAVTAPISGLQLSGQKLKTLQRF